MADEGQDVVDQAIAWHLRLPDATTEQWHAFTRWLEADAAHRDAYDRLALIDAGLAPELDADDRPVAANDVAPSRRRIGFAVAGGGALAAALIAGLLLPGEPAPLGESYAVETAPGGRRSVVLDDGTAIELNGGTRITLRRGDDRYAMLDRGEATFRIRHDAAHPFELQSGASTIRDLGTTFNVTREESWLGVEVAEGAVSFRRTGAAGPPTTLRPGTGLRIGDADARATLRRVERASVGGWRHGLLTFHDTPVAAVAHAVERSTGARLVVEDGLARRPFTGTIHVQGSAQSVVTRVALLVDADLRRDGGAWHLSGRSGDGR